MKPYIDLHLHTNYSDGVKTPSELLEMVKEKKLAVFSITDHDNINGFKKMKTLLSENDPVLISGVEVSTTHDGADMHILAYLFDPDNRQLNDSLDEFQKRRHRRGIKMVEKLNEMNVPLEYSEVEEQAAGGSIGRPHVALALLRKDLVSYYEEAFIKYIGDGKPAYVPKENFTPKEAIDIIHQAGGLAVLAHPGINNKEQYLDLLLEYGIDGIECYHSSHRQSDVDRYINLAKRHRLLISGGSDYHGIENRYGVVGSQRVPYKYYEALIEAKQSR